MIDADALKRDTDILALIGRDTTLKKVGSEEYAGPCPLPGCGGTDRFRVWPSERRWWCRVCNKGGDVIAYVMARDSATFPEAGATLGAVDAQPAATKKPLTPVQPARPAGPPPDDWQRKARAAVLACVNNLWADTGSRARDYLHARGLTDDTLKRWNIGYLPGGPKEWRSVVGLDVPCGIVIPCEIDGVIWYLKTKRAKGEPKYICATGSAAKALFGADNLSGRHDVAVICEGEFDAMLLQQEIGDLAGVCTIGSASNHDIDLAQWGRYLLPIQRLLIATDADEAGRKAAEKLTTLTARAHQAKLPLPGVKDVTDFWKAGGNLRGWIDFELMRLEFQARPILPVPERVVNPPVVAQPEPDGMDADTELRQIHEAAPAHTLADLATIDAEIQRSRARWGSVLAQNPAIAETWAAWRSAGNPLAGLATIAEAAIAARVPWAEGQPFGPEPWRAWGLPPQPSAQPVALGGEELTQ